MQNRDDLIDTVRRLLALSGSPNEHEARAAMAKAQELMLKHQLSMTEIDRAEIAAAGWAEESIWDGMRMPYEMEFVMSILTTFFFVKVYRDSERFDKRRIRWTVRIFGRPDQLPIARHVYFYLSRTFRQLWDRYKATLPRYTYADARTYCNGLHDGLTARLYADRAVQVCESGNALVAMSGELDVAFGNGPGAGLKPRHRTPVRPNERTFLDGYQDGCRIQMRRPLEGAARPALTAQ